MDISTIIGVVVAFGSIIAGYLLEHGVLSALLLPSPFVIVVGGTWGAIILSFGLGQIGAAFKFFLSTVFTKNTPNPEKLIAKMGEMADACRKEGLLKLQTMLDDSDISDDSFLPLKEGMILTLDMKPAEEIAATMEADLETYMVKKNMEIEVFLSAAGFSPTLGIIGTVMGLVQVLGHMTDAEALMSSIGAAFLATLYGILFAHLISFPMANRMQVELTRQKVSREMMIEGMCLIASGKSARDVENQLSLYYHVFKNGQKKYKEGINN